MYKHSLALLTCLGLAACSADPAGEQSERSWWSFGNAKTERAKAAPATAIDSELTHAWLDQYQPRLQEALKGSRMELERRENLLVVSAPVDSSFNPDRPGMLLPAVLGPFSRVAKILEGDPQTGVLVIGHADSSGHRADNRKLSEERARAVASIFRLSGLQGDRLSLLGIGQDMPRAANDSAEGRALNRRVEILLTPQPTLRALLARYSQPQPAAIDSAVAQNASGEKAKSKP